MPHSADPGHLLPGTACRIHNWERSGGQEAGPGGRVDLAGPRSEGKVRNHPLPGTCREDKVDEGEMSGVWCPEFPLARSQPSRTAVLSPHPLPLSEARVQEARAPRAPLARIRSSRMPGSEVSCPLVCPNALFSPPSPHAHCHLPLHHRCRCHGNGMPVTKELASLEPHSPPLPGDFTIPWQSTMGVEPPPPPGHH